MALGEGIGRNKGVKHWSQGRQNDYFRGAKDFIEWLLTNDKYAACTIDTDENKIFSDCGFTEDYWEINAEELLKEFEQSK